MRRWASVRMRLGLLAGVAATGALLLPVGSAVASPAGTVAEFSAGLPEKSLPWLIAPGPDGNIWFTDRASAWAIGRITTGGAISEFSQGLSTFPFAVVAGPDGNLWFTDSNALGRITPGGAISEFRGGGLTLESEPQSIALGREGNLWFTDEGAPKHNTVGLITPGGTIEEPPLGLNPGSRPEYIAMGSDGNLWFTDEGAKPAIGRITPCSPLPCTPTVTEFEVGLNAGSLPEAIAQGPDGNMWFSDLGTTKAIGRVTPGGTIEEFPFGSEPFDLAPGPDGRVWFTDPKAGAIGQVTPCSAAKCTPAISESAAGLNAGAKPFGIAPGADGSMWFTDQGTTTTIGLIGTGVPAALQSPPAVSGGGVAGTPQTCTAAAFSTWNGQQPSASLYGFDGFRWQLDGAPVASGQTYTPTAGQTGHVLTCSETATYPLPLLVTVPATSAAVRVALPPVLVAVPLHAPARPVISALRQSHTRWREGRRLARISAKRKPPVGTTFSFKLSERASVRFVFSQRVPGRKVKGRCVARSKKNARRRACTRTLTRGTLSFTGHARTTNKVVFQGRLPNGRTLPRGAYTLTVTAANTAGRRSAPSSLSFTIVK